MRRMEPTLAVVLTTVLLGLFMAPPRRGAAQTIQGRTVSSGASKGLAAIDTAARSGKYLFVFFWKENDEQSRIMYGVFQSAMNEWAKSADSIGIQITDAREKAVVDKFGVSRAPMPLVVALAPNGAVTKGFPVKFSEEQLQEAFVSRSTEKCLKAIQDRRLVLLCIQSQQTQFNQAARQGVDAFKDDARFAKATEIIILNPGDGTEAALLEGLQVDPQTPTAVTVVLAPPGQPIAKFVGAVTKEQIVAKVTSAQSSPCAGGQCGPGGCYGPKK